MTISLSTAHANWKDGGGMGSLMDIHGSDTCALSESWNDYTDSLCKDGELGALQYHYAPAWDDTMPGEGDTYDELRDDRDFILEAMGVKLEYSRNATLRAGWDAGSSHWTITVKRGDKSYRTVYSMGSARKDPPELAGVLYSLLADARTYEDVNDAMEMAEEVGMTLDTPEDHRKARSLYAACGKTADAISTLFTTSEIEGLAELFEGY